MVCVVEQGMEMPALTEGHNAVDQRGLCPLVHDDDLRVPECALKSSILRAAPGADFELRIGSLELRQGTQAALALGQQVGVRPTTLGLQCCHGVAEHL